MNRWQIALVAVAAMYLLAPLLILAVFKIRAWPEIYLLDADDLPAEAQAYLDETSPGLAACGFQHVACFAVPNQMPNVSAIVSLWIRQDTGQMASATAIRTQGSAAVQRYVEFTTRFADGLTIDTNNSGNIGCFRKVPEKDALYAPGVRTIPELYRLHLYRESQLASPQAPRCLPHEGQEIDLFAESIASDIVRQAEIGYLSELGASGTYRPTLRGAYMMTWQQLPPVKQLLALRMRRIAATQAALAESQPVPAHGSARIVRAEPTRSARAPA